MNDPIGPGPGPGHSVSGAGDGGDPNNPGGAPGSGAGGAAGDQDGGAEPRRKAAPDRFWWIPFLVGVAMLVGYAVLLAHMMEKVDAKDPAWSRLVYLFSGVEALAFGAAGFFFGREVHRGRAESAESRADAESHRASKSEKEATTANSRLQTLHELADGAPATRRGLMESADMETAGAAVALDARMRLEAIAQLSRRWRPRT